MEFISSQKRKPKILHNGFIYVFQKDLANEVRSYECEVRRTGQSKAKIKVDMGDVNEHTHPPSELKVELIKVKSGIRNRAEYSQRIVAIELATASAVANLARIENIKRTIRSQRKDNDQPPNPIARAAIPVLPMQYQETLTVNDFCCLIVAQEMIIEF